MNEAEARALDAHIAGCAAAHQRLLNELEDLTDMQCAAPSLLPDWTRGHVLTHLARNADSNVHLLSCAARGEIGQQYPSVEKRNLDIETGARRNAGDLVADLRSSIYALEAAWSGATASAWDGQGRTTRGTVIEMSALVFSRWREVEIHHADLGLTLTYDDLSPLYVRLELEQQVMLWRSRKPMGLTELPDLAKQLPPAQRLAWLMGRREVAGLAKPDPF